ncbi:hypothetical protein FHL15_005583 [Xylaria flabelliformis]|uniref:Uncharacterized protein n=1 Tax=Xylaria flabelliformis TaxID=2512241 RepID=A0A553I096_9PEZI|nr:hypothetical protein FHL15_005583 [Xylaria flabelliformis]
MSYVNDAIIPLIPYYLSGQNTLDLSNDHFSNEEGLEPYHTPLTLTILSRLSGSALLSNAMNQGLQSSAEPGKRVEKISIDRTLEEDGNTSIKCADETRPRSGYCIVFATPALGCLAHCKITDGGVASTDLPRRTCVYPSYNLEDNRDKSAVLLASYTRAQDANRIGSLVNETNEDELVELILHNLAQLHAQHGMTYDRLKELYTGTYKAYILMVSQPSDRWRFCSLRPRGSTHHAWVVGALDGAYAAVYRFLHIFELQDAIRTLEKEWDKRARVRTEWDSTLASDVRLASENRAS